MKKFATILFCLMANLLFSQLPCTKGINKDDAAQLKQLYDLTGGVTWTNNSNWNNLTRADWYGVRWKIIDNECFVDTLKLRQNNLVSKIIPDLSLPYLRYLTFTYNNMGGILPDFNLPSLEYFYYTREDYISSKDENELIGPLPPFSKSKNLKELYIQNHHKLKGNLPDFDLPKLERLSFSTCNLSGKVPNWHLDFLKELILDCNSDLSEIDQNLTLPSLKYLELQMNRFSGTLRLDNFPNLLNLAASDNQFQDIELTINSKLEYLNISKNRFENLEFIEKMPLLNEIIADHNQLKKVNLLNEVPRLSIMNISNNEIQGNLDFLQYLPQLSSLSATNNQIDTVSNTLTNTNLYDMDLSHNKLKNDLEKFTNLPSMAYLNLSYNNLTDNEKNIVFKNPKIQIDLRNNNLTFKGLKKISPKITEYSPQNLLPIYKKTYFQNQEFLYVKDVEKGNIYTWAETDEPFNTTLFILKNGNNTFIPPKSASYKCIVQNPAFPQLVLKTDFIEIQAEQRGEHDFTIFPSPTTGECSLHISNIKPEQLHITVYDINSKLVFEKHFAYFSNKLDFNFTNFPNGMYVAYIEANKAKFTRKFEVIH